MNARCLGALDTYCDGLGGSDGGGPGCEERSRECCGERAGECDGQCQPADQRRTARMGALHEWPTPFHEGLCGLAVGAGILASGPILPRLPGALWRASGVRLRACGGRPR